MTNTKEDQKMPTTEQQLAELRAQLAAERESRLAWAIEADRLDFELAKARGAHPAGNTEAHVYPSPVSTPPDGDIIEIHAGDDVIADDLVCRDHPEVPTTPGQRDEALQRLGYQRVSRWHEDPDDNSDGRASALVQLFAPSEATP